MRDLRSSVAVAADKLCRRAEGQIQNVVEDEYLAIASGTRADSNGRSGTLAGDEVCHFARNSFQENASHSYAVERSSVPHELFDVGQRLALHLVSAHAIHGLWGEADVCGDGNLRVDDLMNEVGAFFATLDLYHLGPAFFHKAGCIADSFVGTDMVRAVRHVG